MPGKSIWMLVNSMPLKSAYPWYEIRTFSYYVLSIFYHFMGFLQVVQIPPKNELLIHWVTTNPNLLFEEF